METAHAIGPRRKMAVRAIDGPKRIVGRFWHHGFVSLLFREAFRVSSENQEQLLAPSSRLRSWRLDCVSQGMNCPLCDIALKAAGHRGIEVNYCPLCGGTWLDRWGYDNLSRAVTPASHARRRWLRVALLTALLLAVGLVAVVSVGAVKLWPAVRTWTEALLGKETALTSQVRQLAGRVADPRILELSRDGLDNAVISALVGNTGFERLLNSVAAVPNLGPLVRNGSYFKVLQEAARQKVPNLADLKADQIAAPDVRAATVQVQSALRLAPAAGAVAGTVDPAVLELLGSSAFRQLSRSGVLDRLVGAAGQGAPVD
jgi:hypothetical protein